MDREKEQCVGQPMASLQYEDWKQWPKTYKEPTHEDWASEVASLRARIAKQDRDFEEIAEVTQEEFAKMEAQLEKAQERVRELEEQIGQM